MKLFSKEEKRSCMIYLAIISAVLAILINFNIIGRDLFGGERTVYGIYECAMNDAVEYVGLRKKDREDKAIDITIEDLEKISESEALEMIKGFETSDKFKLIKWIEEDLYGSIITKLKKVL